MIQVGSLIEHPLGEHPFVAARDRDRAHVMKASGLEIERKIERVPRS
jgi:hypothetical protein